MICLLTPPPLPLPSVSSTGDTQESEKERQFADWREGGGGQVAKSYNGEKAWSSINPSILTEGQVLKTEHF
jgi:hypothetical protein